MTSDPPEAPENISGDIRPLVAPVVGSRGVWIFAGVAALGAALLFYTLENKRAAPAFGMTSDPDGAPNDLISSPPVPDIPDMSAGNYGDARPAGQIFEQPDTASVSAGAHYHRSSEFPSDYPPMRTPGFSPGYSDAPVSTAAPPPRTDGTPVIVYDANSPGTGITANGATTAKQDERVTARRFQNPSTTLPKGSVIQAVLETALDSTRAGFARAIVSQDMLGFDGTQVLIPKGSRLVGEYKADLVSGQNRALIQWQRLMRPDGVMINLDSPAADPLGRAGVQGKVNSHFLERFSGAILQSVLDVGVQLATRSVSRDTVVLALPGSAQSIAGVTPDKIQPTLKVRQGTSVSVFVSRDLDFSVAGQ